MKLRGGWVAVSAGVVFLAAGSDPRAGVPHIVKLEPGPAVMSEEEKALEPDPSKHSEHGIILLEDQEIDEAEKQYDQIGYHMRAKIFSNEGRDIGNVEIEMGGSGWQLADWWGRTIQPDGSVKELKREELTETVVVRIKGRELRTLKGALPGVQPGCVIDFGYVLLNASIERYLTRWRRLTLQRRWPVRDFHLKWSPHAYFDSGYVLVHTEGLKVQAQKGARELDLAGSDLPPVDQEPWMPPVDTVRGSVSLFYFSRDENPADYWNANAKAVEKRIHAFTGNTKAIQNALAEIPMPDGAGLEEKLKAVYAWLYRNIETHPPELGEGLALYRGDYDGVRTFTPPTAGQILRERKGTDTDLNVLFAGFARVLGAEALLVMATDRSDHLWNQGVASMWQFDESLVAVRAPGTPFSQSVILDPASGLPYGQVPWWVEGGVAFVASSAGFKELTIPYSKPDQNVSEARVAVTIDDPGEGAAVSWTRDGSGNSGLLDFYSLKRGNEAEREKKRASLCGAGADFELSKSSSPAPEPAGARLRLSCEGDMPELPVGPNGEGFALEIEGPWIQPLPELVSTKRIHPLVFDFPHTERLVVEVAPGSGYDLAAEIEPVKIDNPFGTYSLSVSREGEAFKVERTLVLPHAVLPPDRYPGFRRFVQLVQKADKTKLEFARRQP